jgi:lysozyme
MLPLFSQSLSLLLHDLCRCTLGSAAGRHASAVLASVMIIATPLTIEFEGLRQKAYLDAVGIPTICYGETENVRLGDVRSKAECDTMLATKLGFHAAQLDWAVQQDMPPEMHAALASWSYNVGIGAMKKSTLVRLAHGGQFVAACNELPRWIYAKGKRLNGLVIRREKERQLCLSAL